MSPFTYFMTLALGAGVVVLIFGMRYWATVHQAKIRTHANEALRQSITALEASVNDLKTRLTHIETILKDVE